MPLEVNNIYALLAVVVIMLGPAIPSILTFLEMRAKRGTDQEIKGLALRAADTAAEVVIKTEELKHQVSEVHSIINSGAEQAKAQSHEEGRLQGVAESETDAAAQAHNAERKAPKP